MIVSILQMIELRVKQNSHCQRSQGWSRVSDVESLKSTFLIVPSSAPLSVIMCLKFQNYFYVQDIV